MRIDEYNGEDPGSELFAGRILRSPGAAQKINAILRARLPVFFGLAAHSSPEELEFVHATYDAKTLYQMITVAREWVRDDPDIDREARSMLSAFEVDDEIYYDGPRLRVVPHDGFRIAAAKSAYYVHRDTWFANPRQQWNLWMPLFSTPAERGFAIYPDCFTRSVTNDSARFDLAEWNAAGGFQARPDPDGRAAIQVHPRLDPDIPETALGRALAVTGDADDCVFFSAQHLHGTTANASGRTRFSLELRLVRRSDVLAGRGPCETDNASRGSTLTTMRRIRDRSLWPGPESL